MQQRIYYFILIVLIFLVETSCEKKNPHINIITEVGTIEVEIYKNKVPNTSENFLQYIREGRLEGATFYRAVKMDNQPDSKFKIEVLQGGLFEDYHPQALSPIQHEPTSKTGILHKNGVISLARNEPGTATCEFFICIGDQPELDFGGRRNPDGQGFAAFGKVVGGMEIVEQIHQMPTEGQYLNPKIKIIDLILN